MHLPLGLPGNIVHQNGNCVDFTVAIQKELLNLFLICAKMNIFYKNAPLIPVLLGINAGCHLLRLLVLWLRLLLGLWGVFGILGRVLGGRWVADCALGLVAAIRQCTCLRCYYSYCRRTHHLVTPISLGWLALLGEPGRLLGLNLCEEGLYFFLWENTG